MQFLEDIFQSMPGDYLSRMMRNRKNSNDLHALGFLHVRNYQILLQSLNRKTGAKVMITDLCSSKGSRYEIHKKKADEDGISNLSKDHEKQILETKQKP